MRESQPDFSPQPEIGTGREALPNGDKEQYEGYFSEWWPTEMTAAEAMSVAEGLVRRNLGDEDIESKVKLEVNGHEVDFADGPVADVIDRLPGDTPLDAVLYSPEGSFYFESGDNGPAIAGVVTFDDADAALLGEWRQATVKG